MIDDIRTRCTGAAQTPLVLGSMVPGWARQDTDHECIQAVLSGTPQRKLYTAFADADNPSTNRQLDAGTVIHYTALDLRGTDGTGGLAAKIYAGIAAAAANTTAKNKDGAYANTSGLSFDSAIVARYLPRTGTMKDWSGNGYNGTPVGWPKMRDTIDTGHVSMLAQTVAGSFTTALSFPTTSYTKMLWCLVGDLTNWQVFIGSGTGSGMNIVLYYPSNHGVTAGHNNTYTNVIDPTDLVINTWYHYAVTYDSATTTMKLYRNASVVATNAAVAAPSATSPIQLGNYAGGLPLTNGRIDDIVLCNRALTSTEIAEHRTATFR